PTPPTGATSRSSVATTAGPRSLRAATRLKARPWWWSSRASRKPWKSSRSTPGAWCCAMPTRRAAAHPAWTRWPSCAARRADAQRSARTQGYARCGSLRRRSAAVVVVGVHVHRRHANLALLRVHVYVHLGDGHVHFTGADPDLGRVHVVFRQPSALDVHVHVRQPAFLGLGHVDVVVGQLAGLATDFDVGHLAFLGLLHRAGRQQRPAGQCDGTEQHGLLEILHCGSSFNGGPRVIHRRPPAQRCRRRATNPQAADASGDSTVEESGFRADSGTAAVRAARCPVPARWHGPCNAAGTRHGRSVPMKTTASLLTFSIALALATAAQAGLQDPPRDQDTTTQALDERQPPTTDPLDTMDEPLEAANPMQTVTDPLTAQTSDSSTMDQLDTSAGLDPADDMDEPSYDATAAAQQPDQADRPAAAAELGEFANHDPDGDGYIGRDEIPADDA